MATEPNYDIPYRRDEKGKIIYGQKHKDFYYDILDPHIRYVNIEGAVRASKDVFGLNAYSMVIDMHKDTYHLAIATTQAQAIALIFESDGFGLLHLLPGSYMTESEVKDKLVLAWTDTLGRKKYIVASGGGKEDSYKTIRGLGYGSCYGSETNLFHLKTLEEVNRRLQASSWPKWVNTNNPDSPVADYYEKFEKPLTRPNDEKYKNENPNGVWNGPIFRYHHLTQYDNPSLTPERIEENKSTYASETDLNRNFHGIRMASTGAIFDMMTEDNYYDDGLLTVTDKLTMTRIITIDVGTTNPQIYIDCYMDEETGEVFHDKEYRWDSVVEGRQKTDKEYADDLLTFIRSEARGKYDLIIVDPSAASFIAACNAAGLIIIKADNTVIGKYGDTDEQKTDQKKKSVQGIKLVQLGIKLLKLKYNRQKTIEGLKEMHSYAWDSKARERGEEAPLKIKDHFPDADRYLVNTYIKHPMRWLPSKGSD